MPGHPVEKLVREQYERWPYPPVGDDPIALFQQHLRLYETLRNFTLRFWPAGKPRENMRILAAGCGTVAAACYARNYPECRVVGIDLSHASLDSERKIQAHFNLTNLTLHDCPIEEVAKLGETFDFIACQGVLHHCAQPSKALRALGSVLDRDGVIQIAVYGKYPRAQVYAFQELFRLMQLDQSPASVAAVRDTLATLPPGHPLQAYLRDAVDPGTEVGLVDTFLHARDRAYSVPECLDLVRDAGLVFQGWDSNYSYYPDGPFCGNAAMRERLVKLSDEETWQAMEIISGSMRMHEFHICRPDRDPASYRIPWDSERLLACVPGRCVDLLQIGGFPVPPFYAMGRANLQPVPLTANQAAILTKIDGLRTVRECLLAAGATGSDETLLTIARPLLRLLWRTGYGLLCFLRN